MSEVRARLRARGASKPMVDHDPDVDSMSFQSLSEAVDAAAREHVCPVCDQHAISAGKLLEHMNKKHTGAINLKVIANAMHVNQRHLSRCATCSYVPMPGSGGRPHKCETYNALRAQQSSPPAQAPSAPVPSSSAPSQPPKRGMQRSSEVSQPPPRGNPRTGKGQRQPGSQAVSTTSVAHPPLSQPQPPLSQSQPPQSQQQNLGSQQQHLGSQQQHLGSQQQHLESQQQNLESQPQQQQPPPQQQQHQQQQHEDAPALLTDSAAVIVMREELRKYNADAQDDAQKALALARLFGAAGRIKQKARADSPSQDDDDTAGTLAVLYEEAGLLPDLLMPADPLQLADAPLPSAQLRANVVRCATFAAHGEPGRARRALGSLGKLDVADANIEQAVRAKYELDPAPAVAVVSADMIQLARAALDRPEPNDVDERDKLLEVSASKRRTWVREHPNGAPE